MSTDDTILGTSPERPWLGLSSFTEQTQNYFFGREREINELLERIRNQPLTVLFGLSGRGKTSLLGAGILPQLRASGARPVLLRLRQDDTSFVEQLHAAWDQAADKTTSAASLWERGYSKANRATLQAAPPVLILDQFEEVFTLGQQRTAELGALFRELACLIENRVPTELRERLAEDDAFADSFDEQMTPARIVITLREDFLSQLENWKGVLPALMRNRMALLPLNGPQALHAVIQPGRLSKNPLVDTATASSIVRFVAQCDEHTPLEEIEAVPPLLSLLCFELNEARLAMSAAEITASQLEEQKTNILQNFYLRCFQDLPEAVRNVIESPLIVSESGHRNACTEVDLLLALEAAGLDHTLAKASLARLVNARLLTQDQIAGVRRIELTHDLLTPLVVRSRNERRTQQQLAAAETERAATERHNIRLLRERRRWQWTALVMMILTLGAAAATWYAFQAENRANQTLLIAQQTIDRVLTTLESPEMDQVHGFYRIEAQLLDELIPLESDLSKLQSNDDSLEGFSRKVKLDIRAADRLRNNGRQRESASIYLNICQRIATLTTERISPELRDRQFECIYRLDRMRSVLKPGDYNRQYWIEKGIALFENSQSNNYVGWRYWRESFAQQIARNLRDQGQNEHALEILTSALTNLHTIAGTQPNVNATVTSSILNSEIATTLRVLDRMQEAKTIEENYRNQLVKQFQQWPRSRALAKARLFDLFDELDAAFWAKDKSTHIKLTSEVAEIIDRFTGSETKTFEAAKASLLTKQADFLLSVNTDAQEALHTAYTALEKYGQLYEGELIELPQFDDSSNSIRTLMRAINVVISEASESERPELMRQYGTEQIELSAPFLDCAHALGSLSACSQVVQSATNSVLHEKLLETEPSLVINLWSSRRDLLLDAAVEMTKRDQRQASNVLITDRESTESLHNYCYGEHAYSKALLGLSQAHTALRVLKEAKHRCETWTDQYDFDFYLRDSFSGLLRNLARAQEEIGDLTQARATLGQCAAREFKQCYEPYARMLAEGIGGPQDAEQATELMSRKTGIKRFTIPVHKKGGSALTFPFHVYISELSNKHRYKGIEDQAIWLERNRGLIIPQEVRDSFIRLEDIARENNVSFPDLVVYAIGTDQKAEQETKNIPRPKQKPRNRIEQE